MKSFIPEDIFSGFVSRSHRFALCAVAADEVCGVGVFDAKRAARILNIQVLPKWRGELEREILVSIKRVCEKLGCCGICFDVYDEKNGVVSWKKTLFEEGFQKERTVALFRCMLSEIRNTLLVRARYGKNVVSLSKVAPKLRRAYSNELIKRHRYDRFMSGEFDEEISTVYLEHGRIVGCVLVSVSEKESITIEYVDIKSATHRLAMMELLAAAARGLFDRFANSEKDPEVYVLAMNRLAESLVKRIVADAAEVERCYTYVHLTKV